MSRTIRLTRELVDRLPARVDERGLMRAGAPDPDYYKRRASRILSEMQGPKELWVFAAGALIWNRRFEAAERRPALDRGDKCEGIAIRMQPGNLAASLTALLRTEPPLPPQWVEAESEAGTVQAIAFTDARDFVLYRPGPAEDEVADIIAKAVGHLGSMADYLLDTVTHLEQAGIHDPHLRRMQALVAERLERM